MTKFKALFENVTCTRCGGTGNYSYCSMYGTRCFKCAGNGVNLTKRGKAAQMFLNELREIPVEELKVGDTIHCDSFMSGRAWFGRVVSITDQPSSTLSNGQPAGRVFAIVSEHPTCGGMNQHVPHGGSVRKGWTAEEKAAQVAQALAYQATLTKAGVPSKRAQVAA